jgi:hypothetical protein
MFFSHAHFAQPVSRLQIFGNAPWQSLAVLHASPVGAEALLEADGVALATAVAVAVAVGALVAGLAAEAVADVSVDSVWAGVLPPLQAAKTNANVKQPRDDTGEIFMRNPPRRPLYTLRPES